MNGLLFAPQEVVSSLRQFLEIPGMETFIATVAAMRTDIGGKKLRIISSDVMAFVKILNKGYFEQLMETLEKYK
jgi:ABC-type proline/glycine betaine transport system permease subunit